MAKLDSNQVVATSHQTVDALVERSGREAIPIRRSFIQGKVSSKSVPGPLAGFVANNDKYALLLYLLLLTCASKEPYDVTLHSAVWARALGAPKPKSQTARTRVSKAWARLAQRGLIAKGRVRRTAQVTPMVEDGSGTVYTRPPSHFVSIKHEFWTSGPSKTQRWYEVLTLPELAVLLIAHMNGDDFALPAERAPEYYGISADTFERGSKGLVKRGLLDVRKSRKAAPLAPDGYTYESRFTMRAPFGPTGVTSKSTGVVR